MSLADPIPGGKFLTYLSKVGLSLYYYIIHLALSEALLAAIRRREAGHLMCPLEKHRAVKQMYLFKFYPIFFKQWEGFR